MCGWGEGSEMGTQFDLAVKERKKQDMVSKGKNGGGGQDSMGT